MSSSKKIIIASGTYLPEVSGQSTFVSMILDFFPENYDWRVLAYGNNNERRENKIFIIKRNFLRYFFYWLKIIKQKNKSSIIFAQDLVSSGLPAALAKGRNNKLVIRIGGDFLWEKMVSQGKCKVPLSQYYQEPKKFQEKIYLLAYRFVFSRCDFIIFNTDQQKNLYQDFFPFLINKKTTVIENSFLQKSDNNFNDKNLNIDKRNAFEKKEIIYAGRLTPLKNIKRLVNAFNSIEGVDKKLTIIGDGPLKNDLKIIANSNSNIIFKDAMSQKELSRYLLDNCFLLVLPSLSELSPNVALEALGLGVPTVLTQEVGFSDDVKKFFKLVDPMSEKSIKDALEYFFGKENYYSHLRLISQVLSVKDYQVIASKHLEVFESL
jgi:glycosyltransferase involved in cell wall biosynthesis